MGHLRNGHAPAYARHPRGPGPGMPTPGAPGPSSKGPDWSQASCGIPPVRVGCWWLFPARNRASQEKALTGRRGPSTSEPWMSGLSTFKNYRNDSRVFAAKLTLDGLRLENRYDKSAESSSSSENEGRLPERSVE